MLTSVLVVLTAWELYGRTRPLFTSYPTAIAQAAPTIFLPSIVPALGSTMLGFSVGLAIAVPLGIAIGVAMGRNRLVELVLSPYVSALYVTPRIALIPLLVLWFGLDFKLRVAIVALSAVFPIIVNTYAGMKEVDQALLDVGRVFMANGSQRLRTIVLPGSLPYIFTGLRLGVARALGGVIVAELSSSISGIGRLLGNYGRFFKVPELFFTIIVIGVVGLLLTMGLAYIQRRFAPWTAGVRTR
jgi:ABC-type nitrate/sulfonate/bicarbonate transport system permease component